MELFPFGAVGVGGSGVALGEHLEDVHHLEGVLEVLVVLLLRDQVRVDGELVINSAAPVPSPFNLLDLIVDDVEAERVMGEIGALVDDLE